MKLRMPTKINRSVTYLVVFIIVTVGSNLLWTAHAIYVAQQQAQQATQNAIDANNRQWCDSLGLLTSGPVPRPTQPGSLKLYQDFIGLEHHFKCGSS